MPTRSSSRSCFERALPCRRIVFARRRPHRAIPSMVSSSDSHSALVPASGRSGSRMSRLAVIARTGRDGEIDWVAPSERTGGLDDAGRFVAGRLAWAAPHGAAALLDDSPQKVAGTLAAILRAARCELGPNDPPYPSPLCPPSTSSCGERFARRCTRRWAPRSSGLRRCSPLREASSAAPTERGFWRRATSRPGSRRC